MVPIYQRLRSRASLGSTVKDGIRERETYTT